MSVVEPGSSHSRLLQRVKDILLRPSPTWEVIDAEPSSIWQIYRSHVITLALIPAVAGVVGMAIVGVGVPGFGYKAPLIPTLISTVVQYGLSLAMVYVMALIVDGLAPSFGGAKDQLKAFKVAAYSYTAAWLAGIFMLLPMLAPLGLAGLYSFYLLYQGLPRLMKSQPDKSIPYIAVITIISLLLFIVVAAIVSPLQRMDMFAHRAPAGGEVRIGDTRIDVGKLQQAAKDIEAAANGKPGSTEAMDPEGLKPFLPAALGGFSRTETGTDSTGIAGMQASGASATYVRGDSRIKLTVGDLGGMAGIAALGGAFNISHSEESNGKVEKMGKVDGRLTMEQSDAAARHAEYATIVGERFVVSADGDGVTPDEVRAAVRAVDFGQLERMAKK
ncbi:MAG: Yip1 family protein [Phenylobacterium sp.]